jgi:Domain of unknown function (DUF4372)/Transposase DDE domain
MYQGQFVFSQLISLVPKYEFDKCVDKYNGNYRTKDFKCWSQFLCMLFGQLTYRESISDIINCLKAHENKVYHLGIKKLVSVSSLTRANESRDWRIYQDFAHYLIQLVRPLYVDDSEFTLELDNTVYALDSSTIDLCLSSFYWAKFRKNKGAIKMHTLMDLRGNIPVFIEITDGKIHDVNILDNIFFETDAFYIMDKAYIDFEKLFEIDETAAFFVVRAKSNFAYKRLYSNKKDKTKGIKYDQIVKLTSYKSKKLYPDKLRKIKFYDKEKNKIYEFITNNFKLDALLITNLYKQRWQIELFFKWIKQHLKIKSFWGYSQNAVKTQIWIAVSTYLLVAYAKKILHVDKTIYEILQILSVSAFDKTPVNELLTNKGMQDNIKTNYNQLTLFDL